MTNNTPSAKRTNAPVPIDISEAGTVNRAIQIEDRMAEIMQELNYLDDELWEQYCPDYRVSQIHDKIGDLESELSDLQREYRG